MYTKTKQNHQKIPKLSQEDTNIMNTILVADAVYDTILRQLHIDHNDEIYKNLILGSLKRQTNDALVLSIWKHLDTKQKAHLSDFVAETEVTAPFMSLDDILIAFAHLYPALIAKVYKNLTEFFKNFIESFNKISETSF